MTPLTNRCSKCREVKPIECFRRTGRQRQCKDCLAENRKRYYESNRRRVIERAWQYLKSNRARFNEARRNRWPLRNQAARERHNQKQREAVAGLARGYVCGQLRWPGAPEEIVELKRMQLRLHRAAMAVK